MKEKLLGYRDQALETWKNRPIKQKGFILSIILLFFVIVIGGSVLATRSPMVPLYNNLSLQEAGQIKEELDVRGIKHEITESGTAIKVPTELADDLLVELAAQGIPNSGGIDYSFFSQNTSWGVTDNEFDIMKLDAMQTELSNLISGIDGINQANVMINLPQQQLFVAEQQDSASASIVLDTAPGYQFDVGQINALYHLVSKSVPNLDPDDIIIMDAYANYYDFDDGSTVTSGDIYATQQQIKQDIERDIQRRVQQMLGVMVGNDKVVASVTTDLDFTQENRVEQRVEPVSDEVEGLPISIESIHETYTGEGSPEDVAGAGDEDIFNYPAGDSGVGDYELIQESVNYEFNRIQREIVESPYKIRDIGIQVAIDNRKDTVDEEGQLEFLTAAEQAEVEAGIASILESIISTSIDQSYGEIDPATRTSIVFQEFSGMESFDAPVVPVSIPTWVYVVGGILFALIVGLIIMLIRKRSPQEEESFYNYEATNQPRPTEVPDMEEPEDTESSIKRKQLEKMAMDKPEEFAKLLRSWIAED